VLNPANATTGSLCESLFYFTIGAKEKNFGNEAIVWRQ